MARPRCQAKTTAMRICRNYAVNDFRCHLHRKCRHLAGSSSRPVSSDVRSGSHGPGSLRSSVSCSAPGSTAVSDISTHSTQTGLALTNSEFDDAGRSEESECEVTQSVTALEIDPSIQGAQSMSRRRAAKPSTTGRRNMPPLEFGSNGTSVLCNYNSNSPHSTSQNLEPGPSRSIDKGKGRARTPPNSSVSAFVSAAAAPRRPFNRNLTRSPPADRVIHSERSARPVTSRKRSFQGDTSRPAKRLLTAIPSFLRGLCVSSAPGITSARLQRDEVVADAEKTSTALDAAEACSEAALKRVPSATLSSQQFRVSNPHGHYSIDTPSNPVSEDEDTLDPHSQREALDLSVPPILAVNDACQQQRGFDEGYSSEHSSQPTKSGPNRSRLAKRLNAVHHDMDVARVQDDIHRVYDRLGDATNSIHWHIDAKEDRINRMLQGVHENLAKGFGQLHQELFDAHSGAAHQVSAIGSNVTTLVDKVSEVQGTIATFSQRLDDLHESRSRDTGAEKADDKSASLSDKLSTMSNTLARMESNYQDLNNIPAQLTDLLDFLQRSQSASRQQPVTDQGLHSSRSETGNKLRIADAENERLRLSMREKDATINSMIRTNDQWARGNLTDEEQFVQWENIVQGGNSGVGNEVFEVEGEVVENDGRDKDGDSGSKEGSRASERRASF